MSEQETLEEAAEWCAVQARNLEPQSDYERGLEYAYRDAAIYFSRLAGHKWADSTLPEDQANANT